MRKIGKNWKIIETKIINNNQVVMATREFLSVMVGNCFKMFNEKQVTAVKENKIASSFFFFCEQIK